MELVQESEFYKIYWHDDAQTILLMEVYSGWTWTSAYEALATLNNIAGERAKVTKVYNIIHLMLGAQLLPKGGSMLTNIRNLLKEDPSHEEITVYVTQFNFVQSMMQIAGKLYGIRQLVEQYRFVRTLEEAFEVIEKHRQNTEPSPNQ